LIFSANFDAADYHTRILERLEAEHRLNAVLQASVILLDHIVEVSARAHTHLLMENLTAVFELLYGPMRCSVSIKGDGERIAVLQHHANVCGIAEHSLDRRG
jgi:hypothetical protein